LLPGFGAAEASKAGRWMGAEINLSPFLYLQRVASGRVIFGNSGPAARDAANEPCRRIFKVPLV